MFCSSMVASAELEQLKAELEERDKQFSENRAENELMQRQLQTLEATISQLSQEIVEVSGVYSNILLRMFEYSEFLDQRRS